MVSATSGKQLRTAKDSSSSSGRNGSVELLRFLFTSVIILFHINLDLWDQDKVAAVAGGVPVAFFYHGNLGVEFFFLVTGFLMAKSVWKDTCRNKGCVTTPSPCHDSTRGREDKPFSRHDSARSTGQGLQVTPAPASMCFRALFARKPELNCVRRARKRIGIAERSVSWSHPGQGVTRNGQGLPLRENSVPDGLRLLPGRTLRFLSHKISALFPYYLPACLLTPLMRLLTGRKLDTVYFLQRIPSLFFLQRLGLGRPIIGCTWYLSSMLIALAIAYPLCRLFYRAYTHVIGPVLCAVILCVLVFYTGSLGDIEEWFLFTYKTNFRAFAEISMGAAGFELSRLLSGKKYSRLTRVLLSAAAILSLALSLCYICSFAANVWSLPVFCLLFIVVVVSFSGEGALSRAGLFSHPAFQYLGSVSLPMYVTQTLMRMYVPWRFAACSPEVQCLLIYTGILLLAAVMHAAVTRAEDLVKGRRSAHSPAYEGHSSSPLPF